MNFSCEPCTKYIGKPFTRHSSLGTKSHGARERFTNLYMVYLKKNQGALYISISLITSIKRNHDISLSGKPFTPRDVKPYYGSLHGHGLCIRKPKEKRIPILRRFGLIAVKGCPECIQDLQARLN